MYTGASSRGDVCVGLRGAAPMGEHTPRGVWAEGPFASSTNKMAGWLSWAERHPLRHPCRAALQAGHAAAAASECITRGGGAAPAHVSLSPSNNNNKIKPKQPVGAFANSKYPKISLDSEETGNTCQESQEKDAMHKHQKPAGVSF